jgi:osmotically-inducible protein OsmY
MRNILSLSALTLALSAAPVFAEGDSTPEKAGDAVSRASRKAGEAINDSWITGHIKEQFVSDSLIKGRNVSVTTQDHHVTLSGSVQSDIARERALSIARNTDGVVKVTDKLEIDPFK